ncbi:MAG: hypothetical protein AB8I08_35455 [Sandaracinaceae bacterium]
MRRSLLAWCGVVAMGLAPSLALGQEAPPDSAAVEAARAAYAEATAAAAEERWADASRLFAEAYRQSRAPSAAFNAAMALRAQGRHLEARDAFADLLEQHPEWAQRDQVQARRDEEAARVAVLVLEVASPAPPAFQVRLDGRAVEARPADAPSLEVDAGAHVVRVEAEGHDAFEWSGTVADGTRTAIAVALAAHPVVLVPEGPPPEEPGEDILASPWLWLVVGVVVAGGAAVGIFLADDAMQLSPMGPNVVRFE